MLATQRLLEAGAARDVRGAGRLRVVVVGVRQPGAVPDGRDRPPEPYSPYGVTKLAAEHLCGLYAENWGLHTVSLRYFTVFGPRQRPDMSIHRLCEAALTGATFPRFGDGEQIREFTYVADIVAGNLAAADADVAPGTVVNIAGGGEITLNDLIALVGDLAGAPVRIEDHPAEGRRRPFRNGGATDRARELLGWEPQVVAARRHRRPAGLAPVALACRPGVRSAARRQNRHGVAGDQGAVAREPHGMVPPRADACSAASSCWPRRSHQ